MCGKVAPLERNRISIRTYVRTFHGDSPGRTDQEETRVTIRRPRLLSSAGGFRQQANSLDTANQPILRVSLCIGTGGKVQRETGLERRQCQKSSKEAKTSRPNRCGRADAAMDLAIQVLGTVGLVETVVEFTYVVTNRENFTPFEEVFFLTSGCIEMLGEVLFLLLGLWVFLGDKDCNGVKALVRDPVHNLAEAFFHGAAGKEDEVDDDYYLGSFVAILVSVLSLPVWATFWPVWGSLFDGDGDDGLRLALSICSLGLICIYILFSCAERTIFGTSMAMIIIMYATEKVFEEYILLSDLERLCPGDLGKALVAFQLTEILSVAVILACMVWTKFGKST